MKHNPDILNQEEKNDSSVSGILFPAEAGFLPFIWDAGHPTPLSAYPPGSDEQPSHLHRNTNIPGLFGLSTPEVYPHQKSPTDVVSSYLTFSPLSHQRCDGNFLWHWLLPLSRHLPVRKQGALRCPDFPPLPSQAKAIEQTVVISS